MDTLKIKTIPINSLLLISEQLRAKYIEKALTLPQRAKDILFSSDTGAFVRGLAKSYDIDINLSPNVALAILFVAIGEKTLAQLPGIFTTELGLPADKAQKMAQEIESDIFGPVKGELDAFLQGKKGTRTTPSNSPSYEGEKSRTTAPTPTLRLAPLAQSKPNNLLDLKEIAAAKRQEQLNAQPTQKQLPTRQATARIAPPQPRAPLPRAPHPSPLPEQERGTATAAPKFPLPPLPRRSNSEGGTNPPSKPAVSPIDFSKYQ